MESYTLTYSMLKRGIFDTSGTRVKGILISASATPHCEMLNRYQTSNLKKKSKSNLEIRDFSLKKKNAQLVLYRS